MLALRTCPKSLIGGNRLLWFLGTRALHDCQLYYTHVEKYGYVTRIVMQVLKDACLCLKRIQNLRKSTCTYIHESHKNQREWYK
jgi:hypothetical protein